jgi:hypothetical protein
LVFFDALRVKIRDEGMVRNKAIHIALGVRADGTKEILGLWLEQNEGAKFWLRVLNEMRNRGVEDILLAVVDGLKGFPDAIGAAFPETTVQGCIVHLLRHSLDFVSWRDRRLVAAELKEIYRAVDPVAAEAALAAFEAGPWGRKYAAIGPSWRRAWTEVVPFYAFPAEVRRILHHERHRGTEREAAQRRPLQGPLPDRRGRAEAPLSRLEQDRAGVEDAAPRVGHGKGPVRRALRPALHQSPGLTVSFNRPDAHRIPDSPLGRWPVTWIRPSLNSPACQGRAPLCRVPRIRAPATRSPLRLRACQGQP